MISDLKRSPLAKFALNTSQLSDFKRDGVLKLANVFDIQEVGALAAESDRVLQDSKHLLNQNNLRTRFAQHHQTQEKVFETFDPFVDLSELARQVASDARILEPLQSIYGEPACLFKDKFIYKLPGATGATLHQDWISWPGFPESFLTVVVAIDPFTATSGATEFYLGEHQRGYLSARDTQHHILDAKQFASQPEPLVMDPGDMAIFSCFIPHRSAPNLSDNSRRGYFMSYNAFSDGGDQYQPHYSEFHSWVRTRYREPRRSELYFE